MRETLLAIAALIAMVMPNTIASYLGSCGWLWLESATFLCIYYSPRVGAIVSLLLALVYEALSHDDSATDIAIYLATAIFFAYIVDRRQTYMRKLELKNNEALELFEEAFSDNPTALVINTYEGEILQINEAFVTLFGYTELRTVDDWFQSAYPNPSYRELVRKTWASLLETHDKKIPAMCYSVTRADGQVRDVMIGAAKNETNLLVSLTDITDLKETSTQLTILHTAIEHSSASFVLTDTEANILYANSTFSKITGYQLSEAVGNNPKILKSGLTPEQTYVEMWETLHDGKTWSGLLINKKKNGEIYYEDAHISPVLLDGKLTYYVAVKFDRTEQVLAQKKLQDEELKVRTLFYISKDGIHILDINGNILMANPAFCRHLEYDESEICSLNVRDWDIKFSEVELTELLSCNDTYSFETVHKTKTGKIRTVELNMKKVRFADQDTLYCVSHDITETKRVLAELDRQKAQLRRLFESAGDAILILRDNQIIDCNSRALRLFKSDKCNVIGCFPYKLSPEYQPDGYSSEEKSLLLLEKVKEEREILFEWTHTDARGRNFDTEVALSIVEEKPEIITQAIIRDITERKVFYECMELTSQVFECSQEGIVITDAHSIIVRVNKAFTQITGYKESEAIGQTTQLLKSGKHGKEFYEQMWTSIVSTGSWQGEIWNKRKNGEIYPEWLTISCIRNEANAIVHYVAVFTDISKWKEAEKTIWNQANYDTLTGLPNRRLFMTTLEREMLRSNSNVALYFLDLDRFKEVNDSLGHDYGDLLLIEAGRRIKECVRDSDLVARLGGDEFTVIVTNLQSEKPAFNIAQAILDKLSAPFVLKANTVFVSGSIGITFYPKDAVDATSLIKCADQAMYTAKYSGRNQYCFYTEEMSERTSHRLRLARDMRSAVSKNQFFMVYQPVIDLTTGKIVKAECLARWTHPEYGSISPMEFIPIAEETGIIHELGDLLLHQALDFGRRIAEHDIALCINKSPVQFALKSHSWINSIKESNVRICLEITEGVLLQEYDAVRNKLLDYRDNGIDIAIDDFGTGYSNIAYLKKFDIDILKIDQSFVRNLGEDNNDLIMCEAITMMAHRLGIKVVAEGVETAEQCKMLQSLGIDYGQGYLFAKPLMENDFRKMLEAQNAKNFGELTC